MSALSITWLRSHSPRVRIAAAIVLAGGSGLGLTKLRHFLRGIRREQRQLTERAVGGCAQLTKEKGRRGRAAVDASFMRRLRSILAICVPGARTREMALVVLQGLLLYSRTVISDEIAALEGVCAENVTAQNWMGFRKCVIAFAVTCLPASIVNSALKACQLALQLALRKRLTTYLHKSYMANRAYYAASVLGGLSHADKRITDDVDKFCETIAELYSYTLKPIFDLLIFSRSLARIIGYKGQLVLYCYFVFVGAFLRRVSPPLALLTAQYGSLSAAFQSAHYRIAANAEEVAFNDPPAGRTEMIALNGRLDDMIRHSQLTAVQRFVQQCLDGYLVKYTASIIGLTIFAAPLYYAPVKTQTATNVLAGKYINSMRLMMQASAAMGELVLVYKRIHTLAGHTARVGELIEQVKELGRPKGHLEAFRRVQQRMADAKANGAEKGASGSPNGVRRKLSLGKDMSVAPARRLNGSSIKLESVSMWSPDGTLLVRELDVDIPRGTSVILLGPNGSGKSSILRMMAGLWPLQSGTVTLPPRDSMFYLSQRPYMYSGTLAEQLMYPNLPGVVIGENVQFDESLALRCLENVDLSNLVKRCGGLHGAMTWEDTLSGGERQRLAVARLLYHKPKFAVLDECTAAVSADGEVALYEAMAAAGITLMSVAHRRAVMQFHQAAIVLDGSTKWEYKSQMKDYFLGQEEAENTL